MTTSLAAAGLILVLAQTAPPEPVDSAYRVGPGDVLEVFVPGHPELSRLPTVQTTGAIFLPRLGDVPVAGLTTDQIAARIGPLLANGSPPAPEVVVRVKEFQSQFVWVRGEVFRPGRKALRDGTRLIDALLDAGGLTDRASGRVTVERRAGTFPDGGHVLEGQLAGQAPTPAETRLLSLPLASGDVVSVATQHWVSVGGEVARPGRYPLEDGMTLSQLVERAGGLTRFSTSRVKVRRGDPATAGEIEADLKAIQSGRDEDVLLTPGDVVVVSARGL
jgi:polysaccharide biosynthesis/export protein